MAFVVLKTGKGVTMRHDQAMVLQQVIDGQVTPTPELQAKADKIKKIYFNKENFRTAINIPETPRLPYKDSHDV